MTAAAETRYVTVAYGAGEAVYRQASMLLLSLIAFAPHPRELVVVTDHPDRFAWFEDLVAMWPVRSDQVSAWQGPDPFSMRAKLEIARAVAPASGGLMVLDADTVAVADLGPIIAALADGTLFMHKREYELGRSARRGNRALWDELRGRTFAGWRFQPDDAMWNSGVIGLHSSDVSLLSQALTLYDAMAAAGIRHFATEQLVVGLVLGRTGRLQEAQPWFTHYWGNKARFEGEIARRLQDARAGGLSPLAAAGRLRTQPFALSAEERPGKFEKLRRWLARRQVKSGTRAGPPSRTRR